MPHTATPADLDWQHQVAACLRDLDDDLPVEEATAVAHTLCERRRWRALTAEAAARKAWNEPEAVAGV